MTFIYLGIKSDLIKYILYIHIYIYLNILIQDPNIHSPSVTDLSGIVVPNNTKELGYLTFENFTFLSLSFLYSNISFCCKLLYFFIYFIYIYLLYIFYFKLYLLCCYYTFKKDKNNWILYFVYKLLFLSLSGLKNFSSSY